jgi:dipeptidyl aminopeptidase/acylaminoacyl peptidase
MSIDHAHGCIISGLRSINSGPRGVANWRSPVLLLDGDDDRNVAFQQTTDLVEKLRAQNVAFEELIFSDEIHDLLRWSDWILAYRATAEFFDRRLAASDEGQ